MLVPLFDLFSIVMWVNAIIVIVILIYEERDPSTTLAWTLALLLFPVAGLAVYLVFGRNWRRIGRRDKRRIEALRRGDEALAPVYERWGQAAHAAVCDGTQLASRLSRAITRQNDTRPLPCADLELLPSGEQKFARLLADIEAATDHVHLEYFIWEEDELTGRVCDLLARKVREGVEVRVLYDWVGSYRHGKRQLAELRRAGAQVRADAANWSKLNYRNHRKIAVIDGRIAQTGGMNLGQEYVDGKPRYASWRDTDVRFTGPLVADMQRLFAQRWYRTTGVDIFGTRYFPQLECEGDGVVWAQVAHSGAESAHEVLRNLYLVAIGSARQRVRAQSPYFVPDDAVLQAFVTQSLAGVDVRLMMTGVPDKRIAWNAAFSYIDEVVDSGGRVFQYHAGFFHPKTLTIDGEVAIIGTTNLDIRSFMLHDELCVFFFDPAVAAEQDAIFDEDMTLCREIDISEYERFGVARKFVNALARLWSRLL